MASKYVVEGKVLSIDEKSKTIEIKVNHERSSDAFDADIKVRLKYEEGINFPTNDIVGEEVECKAEIKNKEYVINEINLAGEEED